jgi:hypothetical protein
VCAIGVVERDLAQTEYVAEKWQARREGLYSDPNV